MLAVVQIGSKILRSPCNTARSVRAAVGVVCALSKLGADAAAAVATLPLTKVRRDVVIGSPLRRQMTRNSRSRFRHEPFVVGKHNGSVRAANPWPTTSQ